jgi:predicted KAP-like P-loop ATPase
VNPIDFFAITAIQVFTPEVYYGIRDNKDIFSGVSDSGYGDNASNEQAKKRCDEIIGRVTEPSPEVLKDFLKRLFPKLESIYGDGYSSSDRRGNWRKDCRICSPDIFDIYFRLALPKGEISQKEIRAILSLGNNPNAFAKALLKLNEDGRMASFLYCLPDYTQDIPEKDIKHIVTVLMDMGDLFSETDTQRMSSYLLDDMVRRFGSREKRFGILKHAMKNATKSLHTVVREVYVQRSQHGKDGHEHPKPEEKRTVSSEQLKELEKLACDKIKNWERAGRLAKSGYSQSILYLWKEWGQEDEVNVFVKNMVQNDDGLIYFITSFLSESVSAETSYWHINLKSVEEFADLKKIESRLKKIHSSPDFEHLDGQKKLAIKTFLSTLMGNKISPFQ